MRIIKFKGTPTLDIPHPEANRYGYRTLKLKLFTCKTKSVVCAYNPRVWGDLSQNTYEVEAYEYKGRVLARLIKEA